MCLAWFRLAWPLAGTIAVTVYQYHDNRQRGVPLLVHVNVRSASPLQPRCMMGEFGEATAVGFCRRCSEGLMALSCLSHSSRVNEHCKASCLWRGMCQAVCVCVCVCVCESVSPHIMIRESPSKHRPDVRLEVGEEVSSNTARLVVTHLCVGSPQHRWLKHLA